MTDYGPFAEMIRERVSVQDAATALGMEYGRDGRCKCPFCGSSRKDTLRLYPGNRGYFCFSCHAAGGVIRFWREMTGTGFREAVEEINDKFGLGLPLKDADPEMLRRAREETERKRKAVEERKRLEKAALELLWDVGDAVQDCERVLATEGPRTPEEPFSARYEAAAKNLEVLKDRRDRLYALVYGKNAK